MKPQPQYLFAKIVYFFVAVYLIFVWLRPVATKFTWGGGLHQGAIEVRKGKGLGASPRNFLHDHAPHSIGKRPISWQICHLETKQRITTDERLSRKTLKLLSCKTTKDIAFFIDSGCFLEYFNTYEFKSSFPRPWPSQPFHFKNQQTLANYWGG